MFEYTGERYVPWADDFTTGYEHMHRYALAKRYAMGKKVLDLACGEGYGSRHMSDVAEAVTGIEIDADVVKHASTVYKKDNLNYVNGSILDVPIEGNAKFDLITCFEALEHIVEHDELLSEVKRLLKPEGIFLVSTPNKPVYSENGLSQNPYHLKELEFDEFEALMRQHFKYVEFFGQKTYATSKISKLGSRPSLVQEYVIEGDGHDAKYIHKEDPSPRYFIAIASNNEIPILDEASYLIDITYKPGYIAWQHPPVAQTFPDPYMALSSYGLFKKSIKKLLLNVKDAVKGMRNSIFYARDLLMGISQACVLRLKEGKRPVLPVLLERSAQGGCELQFFLLTKALKEGGLSSAALTLGWFSRKNPSLISEKLRNEHIPRINFYKNIARGFSVNQRDIHALRLILKILGPQAILLFHPTSLPIVSLAKEMGVKVIYFEATTPGKDADTYAYLSKHIHDADHVISVSDKGLEVLMETYKYANKGSVISPLIEELSASQHSRNHSSNEFTIVFVGRIIPEKGLDVLINAFYLFYKTHPGARLVIVGDGPHTESVVKNITYRALNGVVRLAGKLSSSELTKYLKQADVFCLPSKSEGTPCSIIEAMSMGLPVVATQVGGIPEMVEDGKTGILVAYSDTVGLAQAFATLANNSTLRAQMGRAGFEKYEQKYNPEIVKAAYVSTLRSITHATCEN